MSLSKSDSSSIVASDCLGSRITVPRCVSRDTIASAEHTEESASFLSNIGDDTDYLNQLIVEKKELKTLVDVGFKHLLRLVDNEISRLVESMTDPEPPKGRRVTLSEVVMVPVDKYPKYNFVGRLLGPRGMTARQLEVETGCRIMVRGRGSTRGSGRRHGDLAPSSPPEPLHVVVECEDYEHEAKKKLDYAVGLLNKMLHPPPEGKDELKRKQLIELSIINGTYRPTPATKYALQSPTLPTNNFTMGVPRSTTRSSSGGSDVEKPVDALMPLFNQALQAAMMTAPLATAEYCRNLLMMSSMSDPSMMSSPDSSYIGSFGHQQAAAMLNSCEMSIFDGAGDAPAKGRRA